MNSIGSVPYCPPELMGLAPEHWYFIEVEVVPGDEKIARLNFNRQCNCIDMVMQLNYSWGIHCFQGELHGRNP